MYKKKIRNNKFWGKKKRKKKNIQTNMNTFPKMFLSGANKVIEEKKHLRRESFSSALALFPQEAQSTARDHRYTEKKTTAGSLSTDLS